MLRRVLRDERFPESPERWASRADARCCSSHARSRISLADPHEKIDNKYTSMTAQSYKSAIEKDVADCCRRGLIALQESAPET